MLWHKPKERPSPGDAGDDDAYIGDRLNRKVVRVKLAYQAEAACPLSP